MKGKSLFWLRMMGCYVRWRMRRDFHDVLVSGLEPLRERIAREPLLLAANHVCWWDPLFVILLDRALGTDGYGIMAADSLRQMPFFERLGALPLARAPSRTTLADLDRAASLLDRPGRFVFIFPSGAQRPAHFPLAFRSGFSRLMTKSHAAIVPIGLRYEFGEGPKPVLLVSIGGALPSTNGSSVALGELEASVAAELRRIDEELERWVANPESEVSPHFESLLFAQARPRRAARVPTLAKWLGRPERDVAR